MYIDEKFADAIGVRLKDLDRLLQIGNDGSAKEVKRTRAKHPSGWEPRVEVSSNGGFIVTEPREEQPEDWSQILDELLPPNVNREDYTIDSKYPIELRAWDSGDGEGGSKRMYYFKARIRRLGAVAGIDLEDLIQAAVKAHSPAKTPNTAGLVERVYWQQITDLQAGQPDGSGIEGMVSKALQLADLAIADIKTLKKSGKEVTQIFVPITGDLVEGISGWYEMQTFSVELDRRDQVKIVRRILLQYLMKIGQLGLPVHVAVVPGNHGENRQNGKAYTTLHDNDDVAVVEQVAEALQLSEKFENITFSFPARERLSLTVEVLGWIVGLTHGHIARGGVGVEGKITNWFRSMAAIRDPIGDSDLLFTGHYHHVRFQQLVGNTYWVQGGALCDSSAWFSQTAGLTNDPAVICGTTTREAIVESVIPHFWRKTPIEADFLD
jgi:hypothetical protein